MIISMLYDVVVKDAGQPTQMAGCGIILSAQQDSQIKKRFLSFGLGCSDFELSNIQAIRLALASVLPPFRKNKTILYVMNNDVRNCMKGDKAKYTDELKELNKWLKYYSDISISLCDFADQIDYTETKRLAMIAAQSQKNTDSGTV